VHRQGVAPRAIYIEAFQASYVEIYFWPRGSIQLKVLQPDGAAVTEDYANYFFCDDCEDFHLHARLYSKLVAAQEIQLDIIGKNFISLPCLV
jgi:hypothetical protein